MSYRRVSFDTVLDTFFASVGDLDGSAELGRWANVWINRRAKFAWEFYFWPEFCLVEERLFRDEWAAATTYGASTSTAPVEVYFSGSQKYYQSLKAANTNNAPATWSGGQWVENSAWWAESQPTYSGLDWAASTSTALGEIRVRGAGSGAGIDYRFYQCHTAHTSGASFDATKFCVLTNFERLIQFEQTGQTAIGEVKAAWDANPRLTASARQLGKRLFQDGIIVRGEQVSVWLEFRERIPSWSGAAYSATTTYALDDQVWDGSSGDYYRSLAAANTGNAVSDATKWVRIPFPYVLAEYAAAGAAADYLLKGENEFVRYGTDRDEAHSILLQEIEKIERQQGQNRQLNVVN